MLPSIVRLSTFDSITSGIILDCEYMTESEFQYYMVIAPLHLLWSSGIDKHKIKSNINDYLKIEIFDSNHHNYHCLIEDVFIGESLLKEDDVFAVLVGVKKNELILKQSVSFNELCPLEKVETYGFPGVIKNEENDRIALKGEIELFSNFKNKILSYRILDDYHHYSDLKDYQILEGLSGAPVYSNNKNLIGMNQSIPYMDNEGNPFKHIYFITLKHIMNYLRDSGCLLYEHNSENLILRWINNEKKVVGEELSVLVIGGSGAGKSSFIKSFALNGDKINSSGDGQTTRTEVEYKYSRYEKNPKVEVFFYNKDDFREIRKKDIWLDIISFVFVNYFEFKELDIFEDHLCYMKELITKLNLINEERKTKKLKSIGEKIIKVAYPLLISREEIEVDKIVDTYLSILSEVSSLENDIKCMKIFDHDFLQDLEFELIKRIEFDININHEENELNQIITNRLQSLLVDSDLFINDSFNSNYDINNLQNRIVREVYDYQCSNKNYSNNDKSTLKTQLEKILYEKKGFFSIDEFDFLFSSDNNFRKILKKTPIRFSSTENEKENSLLMQLSINGDVCVDDIVDSICSRILDKELLRNKKDDLSNILDIIFSSFYEIIENQFQTIGIKSNKLNFSLNDLSPDKQDLLSKCLKTVTVSDKDVVDSSHSRVHSLTSIIKKVSITDSFSNNFAIMFDDLGIKSLTFVDTYGLDHIEKGVSKKRLLKDFFSNQKDNRERKLTRAKQGIDAVFYLKKLDSGRPTELDHILPMIYEVEPQVTLYCIFTGVDIFNLASKENYTLWKSNNVNTPKAVQYLFSQEFQQTIERKLRFSSGRKEIVYHTLKSNIGAFCSIGNDNYYESNKSSLKKILISVLMKEKNSIDIIPERIIEQINDKDYRESLKVEVKTLLRMFFDKSSITNWTDLRWNTIRANAYRITGVKNYQNILGYAGFFRHRWDMIFQDHYNEIFSNERYTRGLVNKFPSHQEKVESVLISMRDNFLGKNEDIYKINTTDISERDSFKQRLISIYEGEKYNPFIPSEVELEDRDKQAEYLNSVLNFRKLVLKNDYLDKFAELYIDRLLDSLKEDRMESISNILKYGEGVKVNIKLAFEEINRIFNFDKESKEQAIDVFNDIVNKVIISNPRIGHNVDE